MFSKHTCPKTSNICPRTLVPLSKNSTVSRSKDGLLGKDCTITEKIGSLNVIQFIFC